MIREPFLAGACSVAVSQSGDKQGNAYIDELFYAARTANVTLNELDNQYLEGWFDCSAVNRRSKCICTIVHLYIPY